MISLIHRNRAAQTGTVATPGERPPADPVDSVGPSVPAPVKDPRQSARMARIDTDIARISKPAGVVAGAVALAAAPFTGGLSIAAVLGLPLLGAEINRVFTRKGASGTAFDQRLQSLAQEVQSPDQKGLFNLKPDEKTLLQGIVNSPGGAQHLPDFFDGAYVRINDGGQLYSQWSQMQSVHERISSHASMGKQYELDGKTTGPVLFGKTADGQGTWVQMERDSGEVNLKSIVRLPFHFQDFVQYKLTHRNQSRYGSSSYTDKNPLVL